ncbi:MAG: ABC transporter permease [Chloroflexota bacterium]|nr:ABC transporter permease [Chloroflexota bacterium]
MLGIQTLLHNAVVGKEFKSRMRGWRSTVIITVYMALLGAIAVAFLVQQTGPTTSESSQVGIQLFQALSIFQLFLIIFVTPASTAGAISGERQRQTWDLLLVTRLSSFGIVWGKLVAGLAFGLLLIFASLPLFSLVFLFGGVAPEDVVHTYLVFLVTILLFGVISLFISALTPRLAVSMVVSNVIALMLSVGLSLLAAYLVGTSQHGSICGPRGCSPPPQPVLTPFAQIDPLVALLSALPNGTGGTLLGGLGVIHHAFGLHLKMQLWEAYCIIGPVASIVLLLLSALLVRNAPRWLTVGTT